ncbi:hypothetical protein BCE33L1280 [Bacillus cereus E33L]|uniref:Uncharacterized protein n=1 Tax=Bacillus cereus (strain ZK / E33L) TaxID=288681 RepID=Q63DY3_BACCZ|nr:hypothetical protein BCE33L1280 [Bacillus cereus E33L]
MLTFTKSQKIFSPISSKKNICLKEGFSSIDTNLLYSINGRPFYKFGNIQRLLLEKGENNKNNAA